MQRLRNIGIIIRSTLHEELHHKSFYLLSLCAILFVVMLRGCFDNDVVVNGQKFDGASIGWHTSLIAFHIITGAGIIVSILLGMKTLRRDRSSGTIAAILSKPVRRIDYIYGKIIGIWLIGYGMTFLLHCTVYCIMIFKTGGRISLFMPASLIVSLNVLCASVMVVFFAQIMPSTMAALLAGVVWIVGYINDTLFLAARQEIVQNVITQLQHGDQTVAVWRIVWPKITALQYYAVSLIKNTTSYPAGQVHPAINVAVYTVLLFLLIKWFFSREEIR